jgi:hypothetical protein
MGDLEDGADPATLAQMYLKTQKRIKELEEQATLIKANLRSAIGFDTVVEPKTWDYEGVKVQWVKGRVMEKLDRAKLVQAGVTKEQLEKGTVKSTYEPTMRVVSADSDE